MTNLLQDHLVVIYDNLFFGLTLGNYDLHLTTESGLLEEYLIVRDKYSYKLQAIERILRTNLEKANSKSILDTKKQLLNFNGLIIDFITYSNPKNKEIIGLSLRVITNDRFNLTFLGNYSENRIQKIMFLLSRGLIKSSFHIINQKSFFIELD